LGEKKEDHSKGRGGKDRKLSKNYLLRLEKGKNLTPGSRSYPARRRGVSRILKRKKTKSSGKKDMTRVD